MYRRTGLSALSKALAGASFEIGVSLNMGSNALVRKSFDLLQALREAPTDLPRQYAYFGVDLSSPAIRTLRPKLEVLDRLGWRLMESERFPGSANHWLKIDHRLFGVYEGTGSIIEVGGDDLRYEATIALLWYFARGPHGLGSLASDPVPVPPSVEVVRAFAPANADLLRYLARDPRRLRHLESRDFERVVADILAEHGHDVEITAATRDHGRDLIVHMRTEFGPLVALVECKQQSPDDPVGIRVVQRLYGVLQSHRADIGLVVTTSSFSRPALQEASRIGRYRMRLRSFRELKEWLIRYRNAADPPATDSESG